MNTKYLVLLSAMAIMLIGATALATEDAFATEKKHYGKSQTTSQVNDCGNDILPENVGCQNTDRQLQGIIRNPFGPGDPFAPLPSC